MNIGALTAAMSTTNTNSDIGVAVLGKSLDAFKQSGEDMTKMMEASVAPNLGQNIDFTV